MKRLGLGAGVLALLVVGCGGGSGPVQQQESTKGTLQLPLTTPGPNGATYRLVGATFTITGPQNVTLTDTSADAISLPLEAGLYTVELGGTWHVELASDPGKPIDIQLISPNPLPFSITKDATSEVRFLFKLPALGTADLGFSVDRGGWISGTMQITDVNTSASDGGTFDELLGKTVPFTISYATASYTKPYFREVDIETGPITVQFGGAPSELLTEKVASSLNGAQLKYSLAINGDGTLQVSPLSVMNFNSGSPPFRIDINPNTAAGGVPDGDGGPALQPFTYRTYGSLASNSSVDSAVGIWNLTVSP